MGHFAPSTKPGDSSDLRMPPLDLGDPMVKFMVDLRDAIGREGQARAHEAIRGFTEAAWPEVAAGLMNLVDPHKPDAALANLQRIYMGDVDKTAPKPAPGPTRDELRLTTSPEAITGLDGLKNLVDPHKPETVVRLAEMYLKSQAAEYA